MWCDIIGNQAASSICEEQQYDNFVGLFAVTLYTCRVQLCSIVFEGNVERQTLQSQWSDTIASLATKLCKYVSHQTQMQANAALSSSAASRALLSQGYTNATMLSNISTQCSYMQQWYEASGACIWETAAYHYVNQSPLCEFDMWTILKCQNTSC